MATDFVGDKTTEMTSPVHEEVDLLFNMDWAPKAFPPEFTCNKKLGEGTIGNVYAGHCAAKRPYAIKIYKSNTDGERQAQKESAVLEYLNRHQVNGETRWLPNLKTHGLLRATRQHYIVLEYVPFPTLRETLTTGGALMPRECLAVIQQLLKCIDFLRRHHVAHRDLKPDNIMYDRASETIRLIDFGLSLWLDARQPDSTVASDYVGTPTYMAPEVLCCEEKYRVLPAEMWSTGIILLELITGRQPFSGCRNIGQLRESQRQLCPASHVPKETRLRTLANSLLRYTPSERIAVDWACLEASRAMRYITMPTKREKRKRDVVQLTDDQPPVKRPRINN
jgi:serine/threonine protein kinase